MSYFVLFYNLIYTPIFIVFVLIYHIILTYICTSIQSAWQQCYWFEGNANELYSYYYIIMFSSPYLPGIC